MADYRTPTVVPQTIPNDDMTPLERLLLTNIFDADDINGEHYFYAEKSPQTLLILDKTELDAAIAASQEHPSSALPAIQEQLSHYEPDQSIVYLDLSAFSWEAIFQDVVRRSNTLEYISVISSFICSKMRSDGFGGGATLITADAILGKSTTDTLEDFLTETGLDQPDDLLTPSTDERHA